MGAARRHACWMPLLVLAGLIPVLGEDTRRRETALRALREQLPKYADAPDVVAQTGNQNEQPSKETASPAPDEADGLRSEGDDVAVLAPVTVTGTRLRSPPRPVRRLPTPRVQRDLPVDDFLSPQAQDAILVRKHLSELDYAVLNRFHLPLLGMSKEQRARQAEQQLRMTVLVNEMSDFVEASARYGADDKETKELTAEVQKLEMARPR